jgi:hypothetical protein
MDLRARFVILISAVLVVTILILTSLTHANRAMIFKVNPADPVVGS